MKYLVCVLAVLAAAESFAKESCDKGSVGKGKETSEIQEFFYTGTCHYRNEDYGLSVENWEKVASLKPVSSKDEGLKVDVLNNLGYMKFFGYGTSRDETAAVSYWQEAILLGHHEAEYHLCHAYADLNQVTFDLAKARAHCEKARLIYKGKEGSDPLILENIEDYLEKIDD